MIVKGGSKENTESMKGGGDRRETEKEREM